MTPQNAAIGVVALVALAAGVLYITKDAVAPSGVVSDTERGAYSELPQRRTVVGYWECLPKKGPGPHTMECAFGIAVDQSDGHYAVNTTLMSTYPIDYPTGTKVQVEGVVVPIDQISANTWQSYDIDGIIQATTITKI